MTFYAYALPHRAARRWMTMADRRQGVHQLPVNVRHESEAFVLTAAVPGLKADDLKINVLEDVVRIEGEIAADENEYVLRELPSGSFFRELRLPCALEAAGAEATISDGILTLRLAKAESAKPKSIRVAVK